MKSTENGCACAEKKCRLERSVLELQIAYVGCNAIVHAKIGGATMIERINKSLWKWSVY